MEHEESIDLGRLMHIMMERKKITGGLVAGCTVLALGVSFILPKQYDVTGSLAERLGDTATASVLEILADTSKGEGYKRAVLGTIYGLPDTDIETLIASTRV